MMKPLTASVRKSGSSPPCDDFDTYGHLFEVDVATGIAERVGDPDNYWDRDDEDNPGLFFCAGPAAYNPVNGKGYWVSWTYSLSGDGVGDHLIEVDLTTGMNTVVGEFRMTASQGGAKRGVSAIAIDADGNAWVTQGDDLPEQGYSSGGKKEMLFSLNLATAELTEIGPTGFLSDGPTSKFFKQSFGLAWNPDDDKVYAYNVSLDRDEPTFFTVNTDTGAFFAPILDPFDYVANSDESFRLPLAIAFDSSGQVWGIFQDIVAAPLSNLTAYRSLTITSTPGFFSESIIVVPSEAADDSTAEDAGREDRQPETSSVAVQGPQLAETGVETGQLIGWVLLSFALLVAGGSMSVLRRKTMSSSS